MINDGTPPDLLLDLTNGGKNSEATKSLSSNLGIPTVSTMIGKEKDIM